MKTNETFYFRSENLFLVGTIIGKLYKEIFEKGCIRLGKLKTIICDYTIENLLPDETVDGILIRPGVLKTRFAYGRKTAVFIKFNYADLTQKISDIDTISWYPVPSIKNHRNGRDICGKETIRESSYQSSKERKKNYRPSND